MDLHGCFNTSHCFRQALLIFHTPMRSTETAPMASPSVQEAEQVQVSAIQVTLTVWEVNMQETPIFPFNRTKPHQQEPCSQTCLAISPAALRFYIRRP